MKTTRRYTMTARAEAVEQTRTRILEAAMTLAETRPVSAITLDAVATAAGVSVQTLLRRFESRAGLIEAVRQHAVAVVAEERRAPVGDIEAAVRIVLEHYELRGDAVLLMLAEEHEDAVTREVTDRGREFHRTWVAETFAPFLPSQPRRRARSCSTCSPSRPTSTPGSSCAATAVSTSPPPSTASTPWCTRCSSH